MGVNTTNGAKLYIATQSSAPYAGTPTTLTEFNALTWQEVGEIEDLGEFGDQSNDVTFTSLGDQRTRHFKGARDAGTQTVVVGTDSSDTGQDYMITAEGTSFDYPFKVEGGDDKLTSGGTNSLSYFYGKVMSKRRQFGAADNIDKRTFTIGVNSAIIDVDPT